MVLGRYYLKIVLPVLHKPWVDGVVLWCEVKEGLFKTLDWLSKWLHSHCSLHLIKYSTMLIYTPKLYIKEELDNVSGNVYVTAQGAPECNKTL